MGNLFGKLGITAIAFIASIANAQDCKDDEVCFFDVKGAECADGTATGFAITYRKDAKDLLILLDGGGACWSEGTCDKGTAKQLTAYGKYEGPYNSSSNPLNEGMGEISNPDSPFSKGFNMVRVPYCTGDVFVGNKVQKYGARTIRHVGYENLKLILAEVASRLPDMERVVFYGISAGGVGVTWNVHQVATTYPKADLFVLNDGGTPFRAPYVDAKKMSDVYAAWGAEKNSPVASYSTSDSYVKDLVEYHQTTFPTARFGYISSYNDLVMTGFAGLLKAPKLTSAVKNTMIGVADDEFAKSSDYQVFYMNGTEHVFFNNDPTTVVSEGVKLGDWVTDMISGDAGWKSARPDKSSP